jgi:hypothetical protein
VYDPGHVQASRENALGYADLLLHQAISMQPKPACVSLVWMRLIFGHRIVSYANALGRSRFGQVLVDYKNGLLGRLDTVDLIQQRAESYVTLRSIKSESRTGQIFLVSQVAVKAPKSANCKGQHQCESTSDNKAGGGDNRAEEKAGVKPKGKKPSSETTCRVAARRIIFPVTAQMQRRTTGVVKSIPDDVMKWRLPPWSYLPT